MFFSGTCNVNTTCSYTSPSGEFSTLSTSAAMFYRSYPDGTILSFYPDGHHFRTIDRFGSTTQVNYGYNWPYADYLPLSITDPTGQSISFWYRDAGSLYGTWKEGSLGNIHTPVGDAPIGVDAANNLTDWDEVGGGYHWRTTYVGQHLLDMAYDEANSAYKHVYRYGATLAYIEAPSIKIDSGPVSGLVRNPRITLRNAADTLLSAAAVTGGGSTASPIPVPKNMRALVIGPRNDTTFFSLNRFGSADTVKAPLTNAASAQYDPLTGQLLRTVSPKGNVTRYVWNADKLTQTNDSTVGKTVNYEYETSAPYSLVKHIYGSVAEQWFTYDQTKSAWPLQFSRVGVSTAAPTTYFPDASGRDTAVVDPAGHRTTTYHGVAGLRNTDSVRAPNGQPTRFGRDSWGRVVSTRIRTAQ